MIMGMKCIHSPVAHLERERAEPAALLDVSLEGVCRLPLVDAHAPAVRRVRHHAGGVHGGRAPRTVEGQLGCKGKGNPNMIKLVNVT